MKTMASEYNDMKIMILVSKVSSFLFEQNMFRYLARNFVTSFVRIITSINEVTFRARTFSHASLPHAYDVQTIGNCMNVNPRKLVGQHFTGYYT